MNKNLSPAERLAQWYYSLNYDQLSEDRKELINDIVADLFEAAQHRMHLTAFGAFCGGTIFGMFVMLILSAFVNGGR